MKNLIYDKVLLSKVLLGLAAFILAYDPILWLINTWKDPSYDSKGFVVFGLCFALFLWSVSSKKTTFQPVDTKFSYALLGVSALMRLIGQVLAVNVLGALTLIIDVFALSRLSGLNLRARPLSPLWLAACFFFCLPLERIVQRTVGYGLQHISANGACTLLDSIFENVACHGVRIVMNAQDVLVDLPCSGARSLLLLLFFFFVCAAVGRFRIRNALAGLCLTLCAALLANILRICILAVGIAYPSMLGGIDVMAQPWHDLIGLFVLGLGCLPIILWTRHFYNAPKTRHKILDQALWLIPRSVQRDGWWLDTSAAKFHKNHSLSLACVFVMLVFGIVNFPHKPIDVAKADLSISLPLNLNGHFAKEVALSPKEQAYFIQYGGFAQKAQYGNQALMIVRTSAPLRHLHAPDECLRGLGMNVEYKGMQYEPMPTAVYKVTDSQNTSYRIAVSFMNGDHSTVTTNVAEAVWRWFQNPHQTWMAIQRISPWDTEAEQLYAFDRAVMSAFEIQSSSQPFLVSTLTGEFSYD